ncbi:MAG: hypothetical protein GPJ54_06690 [Candidatus Heimdallarchaeota archaeon]|nr:hypothetical protein [Candidatus Heimdallarchaeota archaeon]
MALAMYVSMAMTSINVVLLTILLIIYFRNYMEMKAQFSLGLIIFAAVLIINKLLTLYFVLVLMMEHADVLGVPVLILESLQLFAFAILTYITVK